MPPVRARGLAIHQTVSRETALAVCALVQLNPNGEYICCEKSFQRNSHIRSHLSNVHELLPFVCRSDGCAQRFKKMESRENHEKADHALHRPPSDPRLRISMILSHARSFMGDITVDAIVPSTAPDDPPSNYPDSPGSSDSDSGEVPLPTDTSTVATESAKEVYQGKGQASHAKGIQEGHLNIFGQLEPFIETDQADCSPGDEVLPPFPSTDEEMKQFSSSCEEKDLSPSSSEEADLSSSSNDVMEHSLYMEAVLELFPSINEGMTLSNASYEVIQLCRAVAQLPDPSLDGTCSDAADRSGS